MSLPTDALLLAQWQAGKKQHNVRQGACSELEKIASEVTARCQFAMTKQSKLPTCRQVRLQ